MHINNANKRARPSPLGQIKWQSLFTALPGDKRCPSWWRHGLMSHLASLRYLTDTACTSPVVGCDCNMRRCLVLLGGKVKAAWWRSHAMLSPSTRLRPSSLLCLMAELFGFLQLSWIVLTRRWRTIMGKTGLDIFKSWKTHEKYNLYKCHELINKHEHVFGMWAPLWNQQKCIVLISFSIPAFCSRRCWPDHYVNPLLST